MLHSRWNGDGKDVYNKNEYLIEPCVLTALSVQSPTVLRRRNPLLLLEHPTEMLGIFEAETVGHLGDGFPCRKAVLGKLDDEPTDVAARRVSGGLLDDILYHLP